MIETHFRKTYQRLCIDPLLNLGFLQKLHPHVFTCVACLFGISIIPLLSFGFSFWAFLMLMISGFLDTIDGPLARHLKISSPQGAALDIICDRIAEFAFAYAERMGFTKLCVGHKANIIKFSNGMFRDAAYEAARRHPSVACQNLIVDNYGMQLLRDPSQFQVMLFTNLMGDIFSDLCAGIVHGSLGFAGSANIGHTHFIGEAVHGTAPDIVGHGVANPAAMMFSAALMLDHMGMTGSANRLRAAITKTLQDGIVTKDVNRATGVGTEAWTDAVVTRL